MTDPASHPPRRTTLAACCLVAMLPFALGGCTLMDSLFPRSTTEATTPTDAGSDEESKPLVYYTGSAGVPLYREPGREVVTRLPLHQKVLRSKLERGYAYVHVDGSGEAGWLDNAKLIWRLPRAADTAPTAAAPAPQEGDTPADEAAAKGGEESPAAAPETVAAPSPAPEKEAEPAAAPTETEPAVNPSVFQPF